MKEHWTLSIIYNFTAESSPANRSHQHNRAMEKVEVETKEMEEAAEEEEEGEWKVLKEDVWLLVLARRWLPLLSSPRWQRWPSTSSSLRLSSNTTNR